jgi:hypothetical protein
MLRISNFRRGYFILPVFFLLVSNLSAEHPDSALRKINERQSYFNNASKIFDIEIITLLSVVFVERTLNFDWQDEALDIPLAESGYNSSIGFCQVKMNTAYWIELQLSDSTSAFYPGKTYSNLFKISKSAQEIITNLQNDSLNIHYAAAYLRIIVSFWEKSFCPIADRPDILGTLYSTGLFLPSGAIRKPNKKPISNSFGKLVLKNSKRF